MDNNWKLVPVEPTEEMIIAFAETWFSRKRCIDDCEMEDCYRAMIAAAPTPDNNGWRDISTAPDNTTGYAFVWIEYKDRSGPGFFARAFCYKGDWQIDNFKQWDYEHKEPTHWRPIFAPPPPALDKGE